MNVAQSSSLIRDLRAGVTGRAITPGDPGYDEMRVVFPGGVDRRPSIIVLPKNDEDVRQTVTRVREAGVELAIRSGGHTINCSTDGGVVLDLREMTALDVDVVAGTPEQFGTNIRREVERVGKVFRSAGIKEE